METKLNVTKGEAQVIKIDTADFKQLCVAATGKNHVICHMYLPEYVINTNHEADAELFADALNTHNTTGKAPSELMQQRDELLEALREIKNAEHGTYKGTATYLKKVASDAIENFLTKHSNNV